MPKSVLRRSSRVIRPQRFRLGVRLIFLAALVTAATLPLAATAQTAPVSAAASATVKPPAASGTPAAYPPPGNTANAATTAAVTPTATLALALPPPVSVTPAPTPTATTPPIYPPVPKTTGVPRFEAGPCNFNLPPGAVEGKNVKCGNLIVLEEHADPGSPTLTLAVAIVPASGPGPAADPIVYNQGGPGFGSIDVFLPIMLASPLRQKRDQIAFDQRGTGYSQPGLYCPEIISETIATLNQNLSVADSDAKYNTAALLCRDRLVHQGVNLSAYNSQESAADIEDLRLALGYQNLNLYGVSYGSLLVLDTMRFFPNTVRAAVIDGVVPPQGNMNTNVPFSEDRAFAQLFGACAADTVCNTAYPRLKDTFFNLVAQLDAKPAHVRVVDYDTGHSYSAVLNGEGLIGLIFQAMYDSTLVPAIPELINRANHGDFTALEPLLSQVDLDHSWAQAMYWSVYCSENADYNPATLTYPNVRPELLKGQDDNNKAIKALCQGWNVRDLSPALNTPVSSTVPTLLLNGTFDPITPPSNGLLVSQGLTNSTVITVATTAHGAFPALTLSADQASKDCIRDIMSGFLDSPGLRVDAGCLVALPGLTFATPGTLVDYSVLGVVNDLGAHKASLLLPMLALVLATLVLLTSLVLFPLSAIMGGGAQPPEDAAGMIAGADPAALAGGAQAMAGALKPPEMNAGMLLGLAPWLAILAGLLPIAFGVAVYYTVWPLVVNNNLILLLGLPGNLAWVFLIPVVDAVLVLLLTVASLLGLLNKDWSGRRKLYLLFLSFAGIVQVVALGLLGLLTALLPQAIALVKGIIPF